jgi:hypothetical protein
MSIELRSVNPGKAPLGAKGRVTRKAPLEITDDASYKRFATNGAPPAISRLALSRFWPRECCLIVEYIRAAT